MGQPNLFCNQCYKGAFYGIICCAGYKPETCTSFEQEYKCQGGLVFNSPITKEQCYECAESCSGCIPKRIAYGFGTKEELGHLI